MNNIKRKTLRIYIILLVVFGVFFVPMNKEIGYIRGDVPLVHVSTLIVRPIWMQAHSTEYRGGNFDREKFTIIKVNQYTHIFLIALITLSCASHYFVLKKT